MCAKLLKYSWETIGFFLLLAFFGWFQGKAALGMILGASVLHEIGHLLALRILGGRVSYFAASVGGLQIHTDSVGLSYLRESAAVLAGPMVNLAVGITLSVLLPFDPDLAAVAGANMVLGLFNLLPAAPLDGWRFLQLILCWWLGPVSGSRIAAFCGCVCSLLLAVGLFLLMVYSGGNLWLLPTAIAAAVSGVQVFRKEF